jgi:anaerobic magnesium-protoporphyrin IX monomethyl ester cyclase
MDLVKFIRMARKVQGNSYVIPSKILVLVTPGQESILSEALEVGANGFCLKDSPIEKLANAVQMIHNQGSYQDPAIDPLILTSITPG